MHRHAWLAAASLLSAGCASDPLTEIVVVVVGEPAVRAAQPTLVAEVTHNPESPDRVPFFNSSGVWREDEYVIALSPRDASASGRYLVEIQARKDGATIATARLLSGYVKGETRYVKLMLEAACIGVSQCDARSTCHEGACVSAEADPTQFGFDKSGAPWSVDGKSGARAPEGATPRDDPRDEPAPAPPTTKPDAEMPRADASTATGPGQPDAGASPNDAGPRDAGVPTPDAGQRDAGAPPPNSGTCALSSCSQIVTNIRSEQPWTVGMLEACCLDATTCGVRFLVLGADQPCIDPNTLTAPFSP